MLRVFAYSPVSHYALVGLAIGRSLYVSNVSYFVFLFEGTGLLAVLSHVNKLAIYCVVLITIKTKMDQQGEASPAAPKPLKPRILDTETNSPASEKERKHWKKTFQNYITAHETEGARLDKLQVLTNFLSYKLCVYNDECETYDNAIIGLDGVFTKTANEAFARYRLATVRQKPGQSMDEYLQELRRLSKDCNFRAVSETEQRDGFIRDALINGILSHPIRQRF